MKNISSSSKAGKPSQDRRSGRRQWARLERVVAGQVSHAQQADLDPGSGRRLENTAETRYLLAAQLAQTV